MLSPGTIVIAITKQGELIGKIKAHPGGDYLVVQVPHLGDFEVRADQVRLAGHPDQYEVPDPDWDQITPDLILETLVGSRAYGLAQEGSDSDFLGVYVPPFPKTCGIYPPARSAKSADGTKLAWSLDRFCRLALQADPHTMEVLFLPSRVLDPMGEWILQKRDLFVSQQIYGKFGVFAISQLKKFKTKLEKDPENTCRDLAPKNAYNLIRYLHIAIDWLRTGQPQFRPEGPVRDRILQIKKGEVPLIEVVQEAEDLFPKLQQAKAVSPLPAHPDVLGVSELMGQIQTAKARRFFAVPRTL